MRKGGVLISGDKKVPPGGAFLPSYSSSLEGKKCDCKIQGRNMSDEQDRGVFLLLSTICLADVTHIFLFWNLPKILIQSLLITPLISKWTSVLIIFLVVYLVRSPWHLQRLFFTLKTFISTFAPLCKTCCTEMTFNSTVFPLPGDFALRERSKLKTNKTRCLLNLDSSEYFTFRSQLGVDFDC